MERFGSFIKDEGFYMSNGVVTLSKAIGDKNDDLAELRVTKKVT